MEIRTITRRMKTTRNNIFQGMLTREDFEAKLTRLKTVKPSQRPTVCASLCEMFRALNIDCEAGQKDSYYEKLVKSSELPTFRDAEIRIMETIFANFKQYPTPEEYMFRIVNRMSNPEDDWQEDSLRLRILKQFIKYGGCGLYFRDAKNEQGQLVFDKNGMVKQEKITVYGGEGYLKKWTKEKTGKSVKNINEILAKIDDSVFDVLPKATKAQKKATGTYGILKIADDLAQGRFKAGGATKKDLYLFAMVYNMTYYCGDSESDSIIDYDSDIEKNLFEDYYSNNLMRFITEAYSGNLSAYELDPSGMGINYKNFSEMVYIYFISKDYTPIEKIRRATEMIERLEKADSSEKSVSMETQYFMNLFTEEILEKSEEEFELFIQQNYDCNTAYTYMDKDGEEKTSRKSALLMQTTQNRANMVYQELIEGISNTGTELCTCNYGLYFTDISAFQKSSLNSLEAVKAKLQNSKPKIYTDQLFEQFIRLLLGINMFMGIEFLEEESDLEKWTDPLKDTPSIRHLSALYKQDSREITRTSLIIAYYYYYNAVNSKKARKKTFIEVFDDYINPEIGLNAILEEAGYQPINDKNIFDITVIFSSYAYLIC